MTLPTSVGMAIGSVAGQACPRAN